MSTQKKYIKVGGRDYAVVFKPADSDEVLSSKEDAHGYIDYCNSNIVIRSDVSHDFQKENLVHEILHALLDNTGLSDENIERTIEVLTPRLHSFLIDNPHFQEQLLKPE